MKILSDSEYQALLNKKVDNTVVEDLKRQMKHAQEDHEIAIKRKDADVDLKIQKATKTLEDKLAQVTEERNNYKKEVEILTKAFENMGFDVKDMKDILNKLVDWVVSKNTVQLVK